MLRYIFRFNRNFYDPTYVNNFSYMKPSLYNYNNNNNYNFSRGYLYNNYSTTPNKFNNYYNYQLTNYIPKFIDETYNENYYEKNKFLRLLVPSMMLIYITSSFIYNK